MRKLLIYASFLLALPMVALAAFNDVSMTTDTIISVNSIPMTVTGSTAVVESITIDSGTFQVTMPASSHIDIQATNGNTLASALTSGGEYQERVVCNSATGLSLLSLTSASTTSAVVTVTPSSSLCLVSSSSSSSGGNTSGGGGGGGGGGSYSGASAITPVNSGTQVAQSATAGTPASSVASPKAAFNRNLDVGSTGSDVSDLQKFLNTRGFLVASSGPGSPGNETSRFGTLTRLALAKFQAANGITPASGYLGPRTRSFMSSSGESASTPTTPASPSGSYSFSSDLDVGTSGEDVRELQKFLNAKGFGVSASGAGSSGNETTLFGSRTRTALAKFQAANGITPAAGYFGPKTRALVNSLSN